MLEIFTRPGDYDSLKLGCWIGPNYDFNPFPTYQNYHRAVHPKRCLNFTCLFIQLPIQSSQFPKKIILQLRMLVYEFLMHYVMLH